MRFFPVPPFAVALFFLLAPGNPAAAASAQGKNSGPVPLLEEMAVLDGAIREVVSAIAQSDGTRVTRALESVYGPMERAQQASQTGAIILPKNGDRLDDFQRRHESFKAQLDALSRAGQRNDVEAMLMITKSLLEGCVSCHRTFRK